jgi:hypothetical protein
MLGKDLNSFIFYTNPSLDEQKDLLNYYYNTKNIDYRKIGIENFTTKKRLIANTIQYINLSELGNYEINSTLDNAILESYKNIKNQFKNRLEKIINSEHKDKYIRALKELIFVSYFIRSDGFYPLSKNIDSTVDLMNLGVVCQISNDNGAQSVNYLKDKLIIEVCSELIPFDTITKKLIEHFQKSLITDSIKSTTKGNNFELIILSFLLNKKFQNKKLSDLSFIKNNLPNDVEIPDWLNNIEFECDNFQINNDKSLNDIEILKKNLLNKKKIILKPSNNMHPDGIMIFEYNDKYYFFIVCDKMSWDKIR